MNGRRSPGEARVGSEGPAGAGRDVLVGVRPIALVTGASAGIGLAFARLLAAEGHDLILTARGEDRLRALAEDLGRRHGARCEVIAADLARTGAAASLMEEIARRGLDVEVLINNAGIGHYGAFAEIPLDAHTDLIGLNVAAMTALARFCLPAMLVRGRGHILNVASTAAFQPGPFMAAYYASKAYVLSLSEALSEEVAGTGVTVTALCPGPTRSDFQARSGQSHVRLLQWWTLQAPETVARAGWNAMRRRRRVVVPGVMNVLAARAVPFFPRRWTARVVRWLHGGTSGR